ncbi:9873_t:CDS:1, partial [Funneliformis mosseae]
SRESFCESPCDACRACESSCESSCGSSCENFHGKSCKGPCGIS